MAETALRPDQTYDEWLRQPGGGPWAARCMFYGQDDPVHKTLRAVAAKLNELKIPYAVAGGMALSAHRFVRATVGVDILLNPKGLKEVHQKLDRLGFIPPFAGSKNL